MEHSEKSRKNYLLIIIEKFEKKMSRLGKKKDLYPNESVYVGQKLSSAYNKNIKKIREVHCDEVQGYLYSKPVDEHEYQKILKEGIKIESSTNIPEVNRRKYYRIPLEVPIVADMTIKKIGDKRIKLGSTQVLIQNIGPSGLSFYSILKFPKNKNMILRFMTEIFYEELKFKGYIVWYKEKKGSYQYGVEFTFNNDNEQQELTKILNSLQVKLRQNPIIPGCRFYTD